MSAEPSTPPPISAGRAFLFYSMLRLLLLLVTFAVILMFGLPPFVAIALSVFISALLSLVLLRRQREVFTAASVARAERRRAEKQALRARLDEGDATGQ